MYTKKQPTSYKKSIGKLVLATAVLFSTFITQLTPKVEAAGADAQATFYIPTYKMHNNRDTFKFTAVDTLNTGAFGTEYEAQTDQSSSIVHHNYSYQAINPSGEFIAMAPHIPHTIKQPIYISLIQQQGQQKR